MLDYLIRGGNIVDGTGSPAIRGDVGIRDGLVVETGAIEESAVQVFDADGLVVAPGFVDPRTHYDAQLHWDPAATPSSLHGVTTVLAGNCGFTLAPIHPEDADYIRRMMARVEGMPLQALENGVPWSWETFAEYLDSLEGRIGVNAGFMVGHSALRLYVMGQDARSETATDDQLTKMEEILAQSLQSGALGLSTSLASTHTDGDGQPVPSRFSSEEELLALCRVVGQYEGTSLECIIEGCLRAEGFNDHEVDLLATMTAISKRPLNWNVLNPSLVEKDRIARQLLPGDVARDRGGRVAALMMPIDVPMTQSFLTHCSLQMLPDWPQIFKLPVPERMARLRDPATRRWMYDRAKSHEAGTLGTRAANFELYLIGDVYSDANAGLTGRRVGDIAAERNQDAFDVLVDTVLNDDLRTVLWPIRPDDDATWNLRRDVWEDPRAVIGGSDAGAHLDRMCGASYTTSFLAKIIREHQLISLERAVQLLTDIPARLYGLSRRGRIAEGNYADLVVFDPQTIAPGLTETASDLPGNSWRLTTPSTGIVRTFVNGVETVVDGKPTQARGGQILRSGSATAHTATR